MKSPTIYIVLLILIGNFSFAKNQSDPNHDSLRVKPHAWNEKKIILTGGGGYLDRKQQYLLSTPSASTSTITSITGLGPFYIKLEYALGNHVGIGFSFNYSQTKITRFETPRVSGTLKPYDTAYYKLSFLSFNLRCNYHFLKDRLLDPYIGTGIGLKQYKIRFSKTENNSFSGMGYVENYGLPFGFEFTLGLRCFVNRYLGVYIETGISLSYLQGGLCFNIGRN